MRARGGSRESSSVNWEVPAPGREKSGRGVRPRLLHRAEAGYTLSDATGYPRAQPPASRPVPRRLRPCDRAREGGREAATLISSIRGSARPDPTTNTRRERAAVATRLTFGPGNPARRSWKWRYACTPAPSLRPALMPLLRTNPPGTPKKEGRAGAGAGAGRGRGRGRPRSEPGRAPGAICLPDPWVAEVGPGSGQLAGDLPARDRPGLGARSASEKQCRF